MIVLRFKECIVLKFRQNSYLKVIIDIKENEDDKYGCCIKFDPVNPEHLIHENWKENMLLTDIYKKAMNVMYDSDSY